MKNTISICHGGGGRLARDLIKDLFVKRFNNPMLAMLGDSAVFELNGSRLALTTDSYVVNPIFFPGGDIGKLAVCGTVNDLSVVGSKPHYISCGFVIEEGLDLSTLKAIVQSMKTTAKTAGVKVVTGDTKVVEKGKADKIFINTSGVGIIEGDTKFSKDRIKAGDKVIINGFIGEHEIAVL